MKDHELQDWIDGSFNGVATDAESELLEERLLHDEVARKHYLNEANLHASLRRRFSAGEARLSLLLDPPNVGRLSFSRRKVVVGLAVAASVALIASFFDRYVAKSPPTAVIAHVIGAYDEDGATYEAGDTVSPGVFKISRGVARLDFSSGARVSVEGPAQVEVIDEMKVILNQGVVTATIPEPAVGFIIDTPTAHVVDLGTSFGVSVDTAGLTDVYVFDGEVEVSSRDGRKAGAVGKLLREGEAVRTDGKSTPIDTLAYDVSPFEATWPVNSGVLQTTGSMRFVTPGPNFHPGNSVDNKHIVVFPERRGFIPAEPTHVDMVDPGRYERRRNEELPVLLPEQRLTSYLLQLNAFPEGEKPNRRRSVRGQITFAKPIVGVVMANRLLKKSEEVFGIPGVEYPGARMIEPRPEGDQGRGFDSVILAADRRTLLIELQENPGNLDQFRVLVEAE